MADALTGALTDALTSALTAGLPDLLPVRLRPGDDLRDALVSHARDPAGQAAFVIAGIGSLASPMLRFGGTDAATRIEGDVELLTLSGSIGPTGCHLHASLADPSGRVFGGHVAPGCIVRTTAEIPIVRMPAWHFAREPDRATGFDELVIRPAAIRT